MQYAAPACQLERATLSDSREKSTPQDGTQCPAITPWTPVSATAMEIDTTDSRHTGPRNWLRSVEWLINAGLHPKANQTTLAVARDLAKRMDYSTGHVRYGLEDMADRIGIDKSNVKRHVKYLRQLGALAWAQRGTRRNVRREQGLPGYAATATVYAAVIPAVYDHAMGHQVIGTGYGARIVRDYRQMPDTHRQGPASAPVDNASSGPVDNSPERSCAPPSLTSATYEGQVQMVGGDNYTPQAGRRTDFAAQTQTHKRSSNDEHARRTPLQVAREINETRRIRALVNWTQKEPLRRLAYVLRPWFDRGWDSNRITDELTGMCMGWRPKQPSTYIQAAIRQQDAHQAVLAADEAHSVAWQDSTAGQAAANRASLAGFFDLLPSAAEPVRTEEERTIARAQGWTNIQQVIEHLDDHGTDDAIDLYGPDLAAKAARFAATSAFTSTHLFARA